MTSHMHCTAQHEHCQGGLQTALQIGTYHASVTRQTTSIRTTSTGQPLVRRPTRRSPTTLLPPDSAARPPAAVSQPAGYSCTAEHQAGQCRRPDGFPPAKVRLEAVLPTPLSQPRPHRHFCRRSFCFCFFLSLKLPRCVPIFESIMVPTFPRKIVAKLVINPSVTPDDSMGRGLRNRVTV